MSRMTRSEKQLSILGYLIYTSPKITVDEATQKLNQFEFKCGNIFDVKG